MDPYKILGIDSTATDAEVKKAYHALAKKYHPDNYVNNPLADLAADKMKEINEAYNRIQEMRKQEKASGRNSGNKYSGNSGGYSQGYAGGFNNNSYGSYGPRPDTPAEFIRVRELINAGRFSEAEALLSSVQGANAESAEYNFLLGVMMLHKGWMYEARSEFRKACDKEPNNPEYRSALMRMESSPQNDPYARSAGASTGNCCHCFTTMCILDSCLDCLCNR